MQYLSFKKLENSKEILANLRENKHNLFVLENNLLVTAGSSLENHFVLSEATRFLLEVVQQILQTNDFSVFEDFRDTNFSCSTEDENFQLIAEKMYKTQKEIFNNDQK
ncbi:MAG: hypothetical protein MHPSP_001760 [Paramarteilia canceri]